MASLVHEDGDPLPSGLRAPRTTEATVDSQAVARAVKPSTSSSARAKGKQLLLGGLRDGQVKRLLDEAEAAEKQAPAVERVLPGASLPSKSPPPSASPRGATLVEGVLNEPSCRRDASPPPRRGMRAPKHTMVFEDSMLESIDPELRKLGDDATTLPLEGEVGELATQLKRELLKMSEDELTSGCHDCPPPAHAWMAPTDEVISEKGTRNSYSMVDGQMLGEELLAEKLADGNTLSKLHVGDRTPDFSGYSRLTPLIIESFSARLSSLSKEEIRSENQQLRDDISNLRSEIHRRRQEEQLMVVRIPGETGT